MAELTTKRGNEGNGHYATAAARHRLRAQFEEMYGLPYRKAMGRAGRVTLRAVWDPVRLRYVAEWAVYRYVGNLSSDGVQQLYSGTDVDMVMALAALE